MKYTCLLPLLLLASSMLNAQQRVYYNIHIDNFPGGETLYLDFGNNLVRIESSPANGKKSMAMYMDDQPLPSFISVAKISGNGRVEHLMPRIWYRSDTVHLAMDLKSRAYQIEERLPFQQVSEKIESLQGKARTQYLLTREPDAAVLYFADRDKKQFSLPDLEKMLAATPEAYRSLDYANSIKSYITAKRLPPAKKGSALQSFQLEDRDGKLHTVTRPGKGSRLIALLSSGCAYSLESLATLQRLHQSGGDKMDIVTVWNDAGRDTWLNAHNDKKSAIAWLDLWDPYRFAANYLEQAITPAFFIVNSEGVLTDKFEGLSQKNIKRLEQAFK